MSAVENMEPLSVEVSQEQLDKMIEGLDAFRGVLPNRKRGEVMTLQEVYGVLKELRSRCK